MTQFVVFEHMSSVQLVYDMNTQPKGEGDVLVTRNALEKGLKHFSELILINLLSNFVVKGSLKLRLRRVLSTKAVKVVL